MQKQIKDLLPEWVHTIQNRNLTLTNDLDSLISCALLKHLFGYEINYFYTFSYMAILDKSDIRKSIGVDVALKQGYCYDNHLTMLTANSYKNPESANPNNILNISNDNYNQKFSMSTLIFLWSLYDVPLPESEIGKKILLSIDSGHKGYRKPEYRHILVEWLEILGMEELIQTLDDNPFMEMEDFYRRHELDSSIILQKDGSLKFNASGRNPYFLGDELNIDWISEHLGFPIELPEKKFQPFGAFTNNNVESWEMNKKTIDESFSYAFTYKNKVRLSKLKGASA